MANITQAYYKMFILDELAAQKTPIHRIHPVVKLFVTLLYLVVVVSYGKYEIGGLIPLILYPVFIMAAAEIPIRPMLGGLAIAAPLVIGIGIFNPLLDRTIAVTVLGINISAGVISFAALMLKCGLTVLAALLLLATTGINNISAALHKLHVPQVFIIQLLLTYRYISVLLTEAFRIYNAYFLRAPQQKGISSKVWGPLLGQLLLRTYDRACRVYQAMKLRGFDSQYYGVSIEKTSRADIIYIVSWVIFFVTVRLFNIPMILGLLITEVIK
ncbi:MAG: cobalt ECF transporter T component CbiQ [Clostridiales bacterium GWB2_37_7]|nr:MAG: cobalt ECF transporter T component CbiQ [Clostridiales bacterium GWB2_37_7]